VSKRILTHLRRALAPLAGQLARRLDLVVGAACNPIAMWKPLGCGIASKRTMAHNDTARSAAEKLRSEDFHGRCLPQLRGDSDAPGSQWVPLVVAQRVLRHTDPRLTANVYSRVDLADLRQDRPMPPQCPAHHCSDCIEPRVLRARSANAGAMGRTRG